MMSNSDNSPGSVSDNTGTGMPGKSNEHKLML